MRLVRPSVLSFVLSSFAASAAAQVAWVDANPGTAPCPRKYTVMVWDSVRQRVVLFGGQEDLATYHNDTWEWDGTRWIELQPAHRPPAREDHMMAFDSVRGRVVLFGGHDVNVRFFNDTWEWDGVDWQQRTPATVPPRRAYGAMAFDPLRGVCTVYGGVDDAIREIGETWEWNGTDWRVRFPPREPGRRTELAMCWHPVRQRITIYGGRTNAGGWLSDQWEFDGATWTDVSTTPRGPALADLRMVYDTVRDRIVLWGGQGQPGNTSWELDNGTWVQRGIPAPAPADRQAHTMAFDQARGETVMFGGYNAGTGVRYGDTWVYRSVSVPHAASFGQGCGGASLPAPVLELAPGQRPWIGDRLVWHVTGMTSPHAAMLALGASCQGWHGTPLPLDLSPYGMPGCQLLTSADIPLPMPPSPSGAELATVVPTEVGLIGARAYVQAVVPEPAANPAGVMLTAGVQLQFGAR